MGKVKAREADALKPCLLSGRCGKFSTNKPWDQNFPWRLDPEQTFLVDLTFLLEIHWGINGDILLKHWLWKNAPTSSTSTQDVILISYQDYFSRWILMVQHLKKCFIVLICQWSINLPFHGLLPPVATLIMPLILGRTLLTCGKRAAKLHFEGHAEIIS